MGSFGVRVGQGVMVCRGEGVPRQRVPIGEWRGNVNASKHLCVYHNFLQVRNSDPVNSGKAIAARLCATRDVGSLANDSTLGFAFGGITKPVELTPGIRALCPVSGLPSGAIVAQMCPFIHSTIYCMGRAAAAGLERSR